MGYQEKDEGPSYWDYLRVYAFGAGIFLIFGLASSNIGIVSDLLHHFGDDGGLYPSEEFKNVLGIVLFSGIVSLLVILSHPWSNHFLMAVWSLILAGFWGAAGGILNRVTPFEFYTCFRPLDFFEPKWQPYVSRCPEIVAMQGMSWTLWVLFMFMLLGMLVQLFEIQRKPHAKGFYQIV